MCLSCSTHSVQSELRPREFGQHGRFSFMSAIFLETSLSVDQAVLSPGVCAGSGSRHVAKAVWESGPDST